MIEIETLDDTPALWDRLDEIAAMEPGDYESLLRQLRKLCFSDADELNQEVIARRFAYSRLRLTGSWDDFAPIADLYAAYLAWTKADRQGDLSMRALSQSQLAKGLERLDGVVYTQRRIDGKRIRGLSGLSFRDDEPEAAALRFARSELIITGNKNDFIPIVCIYAAYLEWLEREGVPRAISQPQLLTALKRLEGVGGSRRFVRHCKMTILSGVKAKCLNS